MLKPLLVALALSLAAHAQAPAVAPAPAPARPQEQARPGPEKISLDEAVRRALLHNPNAKVAIEEIARAQGLVHEVRVQALPALSGNGIYTLLDSDRVLNQKVISAKNQLGLNAQLSVPLLAASRWAAWAHAGENVELARVSAEEVRRTVAVATARAYLAVLAQHRLVDINQRARENAKDHLDYTRARLEAGTGNRLDQVRAGQEMSTDEANLASGLIGLARSEEALGVLVGADAPLDTASEPELATPPLEREAMEDAQTKRPDVRAAKVRADAARHVLETSWTDFLPVLTGVAEPFYQNPPTLTQPQTGWQAQLILSIPFYDGGLRYGLRRERAALANQARELVEAALRQARSDVRFAFEELRRSDEALLSAREASRLANEALGMTQLAYREGATNDLEVVDAERRARDADSATLSAEDSARQSRIDLLAASGHFP